MKSSEWMDYYSDSECDGAYYGNFLSDTDSTKTKKSCFKKLRALLFFGIVGTALFGSLLIYFTVVSPLLFSSDQNSTSAQPAANAPEAHQPLKLSCITKRVVGYYPGSLEVNTGQLQKLTHIIFEYVKLDRGHILKFENKTSEERFLEMKKKAREVNEDLKVMISIGAKDQSNEFQIFLSDEIYRPKLIKAILSLIEKYDIDGVDIFWLYVFPSIKQEYLEFTQELRQKFDKLGKASLISITVSPTDYPRPLKNRYLWEDLVEKVDFINVFTYDYFVTRRDTYIGPSSPIYGGNTENLDSTMKQITCKTGNPQKLNFFIPSYGTYWTNVTSPFSKGYLKWVSPLRYFFDWSLYHRDLKKQRVKYRDLKEFLKQWPGAEYHFHNESKSSYYWIPESETFITIEDEQSLREKVKYQDEMNIGGIGIMAIENDDDENTLLKAISADEKSCLTNKDYEVKYDCNQKTQEFKFDMGKFKIMLHNLTNVLTDLGKKLE